MSTEIKIKDLQYVRFSGFLVPHPRPKFEFLFKLFQLNLMLTRIFYLLLISLFSAIQILAQRVATIQEIDHKVNIDGVLNESFWEDQFQINDFINQWPVDSGYAKSQTIIKMAFDQNFIYLGIQCFENDNENIVRTLKRDKLDEHFGSDGIGIILDPVNEKSTGFFFGVNAGGAQLEGLIRVIDSRSTIDENWDNKWLSAVHQGDSVWYAELAIPFRTLRYDPSKSTWGINFVRSDMKNNVYSTWNNVPINFDSFDLGYTGILQWDNNPPKVKNGSINILPYLSSSLNRDYENDSDLINNNNFGTDAKISITPSLNLDLTVNPDFSTVDVDVQQTNLTRFSLFFPERRGFFLENSDLFTSFGIRSINPFFSRRIGLAGGQTIPILYGLRLTGNISNKSRVGLLNVRTSSKNETNEQNYTVGAYQFRLGKRSSFNALIVDRRNENDAQNAYNSVAAVNLKLLTPDGKLGGEVGYHKSFNPEDLSNEQSLSSSLVYTSKNIFNSLTFHKVGRDYITDVGFVPKLYNYDAARDTTIRIGFTQFRHLFIYDFYPKSKRINLHSPILSSDVRMDENSNLVAAFLGLSYYVTLQNRNEFEINYNYEYQNLPFSSYIVGDIPFDKGIYKNQNIGFYYRSDPRKKISITTTGSIGSFYNGTRKNLINRINYRMQPWGNFGVSYEINDIDLPETLQSNFLHLLGPVIEISFSNSMFWTTFIQLNTQTENLNINSRFQWRYRSMSDLFIVYSDNYTSSNLNIKNRGLVLKITYWM